MKGEKGITIIAPAPYKKMKEKEVLDENQRPIMAIDLIESNRHWGYFLNSLHERIKILYSCSQ